MTRLAVSPKPFEPEFIAGLKAIFEERVVLSFSRKSLLAILFPLALPLLGLAALQIPLKALLLKLVKTLV